MKAFATCSQETRNMISKVYTSMVQRDPNDRAAALEVWKAWRDLAKYLVKSDPIFKKLSELEFFNQDEPWARLYANHPSVGYCTVCDSKDHEMDDDGCVKFLSAKGRTAKKLSEYRSLVHRGKLPNTVRFEDYWRYDIQREEKTCNKAFPPKS